MPPPGIKPGSFYLLGESVDTLHHWQKKDDRILLLDNEDLVPVKLDANRSIHFIFTDSQCKKSYVYILKNEFYYLASEEQLSEQILFFLPENNLQQFAERFRQ